MFDNAIGVLRENSNFLIVHDTDGDGLGAAVILAKTIKRISNRKPKVVAKNYGVSFIPKNFLKSKDKPDVIIFLDITADEKSDYMIKLSKKYKIIIIDHHKFVKNLNRYRNIIHLNPAMWKIRIPSHRYNTSKILYDLCSRVTDIDDLDWLAGIGIVNDKAEVAWKDFLKKIYRKYKISPKELETINNIATSTYQISKSKNTSLSFKACYEVEGPKDILKARTRNSKKLRKLYNSIEEEIKKAMKDWSKRAEIYNDRKLIILELKTKFSIGSIISTKISFSKKNYTVITFRKKGKFVSVNLRRQDRKVDCSKLAKELVKGINNSSGGGHAPAAGIKILRKDWKIVRSRIDNIL